MNLALKTYRGDNGDKARLDLKLSFRNQQSCTCPPGEQPLGLAPGSWEQASLDETLRNSPLTSQTLEIPNVPGPLLLLTD